MGKSAMTANFSGTASYTTASKPDKKRVVEVTARFTLEPDNGVLACVVAIKNGGKSEQETPVTYKTLPPGYALCSIARDAVESLLKSARHNPIGGIVVTWGRS